jgi:hypothetical protein
MLCTSNHCMIFNSRNDFARISHYPICRIMQLRTTIDYLTRLSIERVAQKTVGQPRIQPEGSSPLPGIQKSVPGGHIVPDECQEKLRLDPSG